jgi:hypothetical protein
MFSWLFPAFFVSSWEEAKAIRARMKRTRAISF